VSFENICAIPRSTQSVVRILVGVQGKSTRINLEPRT
jgi:hypothetical protein